MITFLPLLINHCFSFSTIKIRFIHKSGYIRIRASGCIQAILLILDDEHNHPWCFIRRQLASDNQRGISILSVSSPFPILIYSCIGNVWRRIPLILYLFWLDYLPCCIPTRAEQCVQTTRGEKKCHKTWGWNKELSVNLFSFKNISYYLNLKCLETWYLYTCAVTTKQKIFPTHRVPYCFYQYSYDLLDEK